MKRKKKRAGKPTSFAKATEADRSLGGGRPKPAKRAKRAKAALSLPKGGARWEYPAPEPALARGIASELGLSPVTAQVLVNRGVRDAAAAESFLRPKLTNLEDPGSMLGLAEAAERIHAAIGRKERVLVFGDYDVDGITASVLLYRFVRLCGGECGIYLPSRANEGYGLSPKAADEIIRRRPDLLVTVDCGVGSPEEVARVRDAGVNVIVTDHHPPGDTLDVVLGEAHAVVNPRRPGCPYPFKDLAGVGVAFMLAWEAAKRFSRSKKVSPELREFLRESVGLVALGTVSDVAPLLGQNRLLVHYGLGVLSASSHPGVRGLMEVSRLRGKAVTAEDIAFRLGPRINAAGRIGSPEPALAALLEDNPERAHSAARELERANRERRRQQDRILREAEGRPEVAEAGRASLVLCSDEWNTGVLGIVASKLAERTGRPTVLVSFGGAPPGGGSPPAGGFPPAGGDPDVEVGRGSARSVKGVNISEALASCAEHLESHGGHAAAAGVSVRRESVAPFAEEFERAVRALSGKGEPAPLIELEGELDPGDLTLDLAREIDRLEPFGCGNPRPVFMARGMELGGDLRPLGADGKHFAFGVSAGEKRHRAVAFGFGERRRLADLAWKRADIAFELRRSKWSGPAGFELCVKDLRPSSPRSRGPRRPAAG